MRDIEGEVDHESTTFVMVVVTAISVGGCNFKSGDPPDPTCSFTAVSIFFNDKDDGFVDDSDAFAMDSHIDDHHQKDYMSSFFPSVDLDHLQNDSDMGIMQQTAHNTQHNQTMMHGLGMPPQLDMEMLGSLMSMQGIDSPQHPLSGASPSQTHFPPNSNANNPQMIIEQYKLAQLQQLQQLQNQIFQQQVNSHTRLLVTYTLVLILSRWR